MDQETASVIRKYQAAPPVDVQAVARDLGINVYMANLGDNVSGILRKDVRHGGRSGYLILVQQVHPSNRRRFTVAHELGHFVLHRAQVDERGEVNEDEFYRAFSGPLETEANRFAADLLMPWNLINEIMDSGTKDLPSMAARLGVSKQALAIRMGIPYETAWD